MKNFIQRLVLAAAGVAFIVFVQVANAAGPSDGHYVGKGSKYGEATNISCALGELDLTVLEGKIS